MRGTLRSSLPVGLKNPTRLEILPTLTPPFSDGEEKVAVSETLSALSFALDLTEGAVPGHAIRTCVLGMRIGMALQLDRTLLSDLYYALLLKDIGCSSNAARMSEVLGGDERRAKQAIKTIDWTDSGLQCILWAAKHALPGSSAWRKIKRIVEMKWHGEEDKLALSLARSERGAEIARKLGIGERGAAAIYSLDEHWNGNGVPDHLAADKIPLLSRILAIAQHLDILAGMRGQAHAIDTLKERSGRWFDPDLVRLTLDLHRSGQLWEDWNTGSERKIMAELEPGGSHIIGAAQVDLICEAFAEVVDAKSPMTYRHSLRVMQAANAISGRIGLEPQRRKLIHRAALLHDIGKLRVPNSILDKRGPLTPAEWAVVWEHPNLSYEILARISSFDRVAIVAGRHHERLDGSGYPGGLTAKELTLEDCVVATADVYATLAEDRPYRPAMQPDAIISIFNRLEQTGKLMPICCDALREEIL
jgi:putative nucleotidyltransferase with HDIG domain